MTGAPKLRTVQLLEEYEGGRRRGIYSGMSLSAYRADDKVPSDTFH
jgi:anthranilate/para-aminobenzoate synthase component I